MRPHLRVMVGCPLQAMQGRLGSLCWRGQMECKHRQIIELQKHLLVIICTFYNSAVIEITSVEFVFAAIVALPATNPAATVASNCKLTEPP